MSFFFSKFSRKVFSYCFIFISFISCYKNNRNDVKAPIIYNDSIDILFDKANKEGIDFEKKKEELDFVLNLIQSEEKGSSQNKKLLKVAYEAYRLNDLVLFKLANKKAYTISKKIKDTLGIAEYHWNLGEFFKDKEIMDSAYYHYYEASKSYKSINHHYYYGKMLFNMAFVQGRVNDYTGSEKLTFQAISKFEPLKKYKSLYYCYNHLGLIFNELEEFEKAVFYHNQALSYLEKFKDDKVCKEGSFNNLSLVYGKQKNYTIAIVYLNKALKNDNLINLNINLYAKLIDNRAYYKFLNGDSLNVLRTFKKALKIRDSLNRESGIVISKLHLAEFYTKYNDTLKAVKNARKAYVLAKKINNNRDKLASLKLLSKIDLTNSKKFFNEYFELIDSLHNEERKIRNKFARIRFETDEYFEETQRLSEQKMWITLVSFFVLFLFSLLYFIKRQQSRNNELIFEKNQQMANEEIYSLLLKQQTKLEEGRLEERNRISEELHDGVLGKLFGTRMGFGFLNLKGDDKTMRKYKSHIRDIQQIEKEIRTISHELKRGLLFSNLSFISSIKALLDKKKEIHSYKYTIDSDKNIVWNDIDEKIKISLYRIIQEAMQNINKYSKANNISLKFILLNKTLQFTINDNGRGFNIEKKKRGIGLRNIRSRTKKLGGKFKINSIINEGTTIIISIPVKV